MARASVSGYLRRFDGWTALVASIAAELGVGDADILGIDKEGDRPSRSSRRVRSAATSRS